MINAKRRFLWGITTAIFLSVLVCNTSDCSEATEITTLIEKNKYENAEEASVKSCLLSFIESLCINKNIENIYIASVDLEIDEIQYSNDTTIVCGNAVLSDSYNCKINMNFYATLNYNGSRRYEVTSFKKSTSTEVLFFL